MGQNCSAGYRRTKLAFPLFRNSRNCSQAGRIFEDALPREAFGASSLLALS
jgi:hypothetical protein